MRPTATDRVVLQVGWSVCLSASPAKMAELIEIGQTIDLPFGLWTQLGPSNHILDGGPDAPRARSILRGRDGAVHCKVWGHSAVSCANG